MGLLLPVFMGKSQFGEVRCTYIIHVLERCSCQNFPPNIIIRVSFFSFYYVGDSVGRERVFIWWF